MAAILDRNPFRGHLEVMVKIQLSSVMVDDQAKALKFYTEVLGFVKKTDLPVGAFNGSLLITGAGYAGGRQRR